MNVRRFLKREFHAVLRKRLAVFMLGVLVASLFFLMPVLLLGCASYQAWQRGQMRHQFFRELTYYLDGRTGTCWAVREGGAGGIAVVDPKHCKKSKN